MRLDDDSDFFTSQYRRDEGRMDEEAREDAWWDAWDDRDVDVDDEEQEDE